jgi:TolA-binding protein
MPFFLSLSRPRVAFALLPCLVAGCATTRASELVPLHEEVAALRQAHEADRKRIDSLEIQVGLQQAELLRLRGGGVIADGKSDHGALPIVHLQPHAAKDLPAIPTLTNVREPPPEVVAELQKPVSLEEGEGSSLGGTDEADGIFKSAFEKLKTGELVGAAGMFHTFALRFPHHPAADNAMLDEGIAYYGLRRYGDALEVFEQLAKRYPAGDAVSEGLYRAADCHLKLGDPAKAKQAYQALVKRYPDSPEAQKATSQLAALDNKDSHVASTEGGSP